MITTIKLISMSIATYNYHYFFVANIWDLLLANFKYLLLLPVVTMLCVRSPEFIHFITKSLYPLINISLLPPCPWLLFYSLLLWTWLKKKILHVSEISIVWSHYYVNSLSLSLSLFLCNYVSVSVSLLFTLSYRLNSLCSPSLVIWYAEYLSVSMPIYLLQ